MGITVVRAFVSNHRAPTLDDLLDHFDHVAHVAGVEHLGLGSDLDADVVDPTTGRPRAPYLIRGLDPRGRVFQIADGLLSRGYKPSDVELILGGNFLRVLGEIWGDSPAPADPQERRDPFCPAPRPRVPASIVG
jgi:membrane dipeptidase